MQSKFTVSGLPATAERKARSRSEMYHSETDQNKKGEQ